MLALVAAGCGTESDPFEIGFRRVALDLAFKDAAKADPPLPPREIIQYLPVEGEYLDDLEDVEPTQRRQRTVFNVPPRPPKFVCDTAEETATPAVPTFPVAKLPPIEGRYNRHNKGTIDVQIGNQGFELPYPEKSTWEIRGVKPVTASTYVNSEDVDRANPPSDVRNNATAFPSRMEFSLTRSVRTLVGTISVTDTFRYALDDSASSRSYLWLVKRVTVANGATSVFNPTPPIRYIKLFISEGETEARIVHGGIDRATNIALQVESNITNREWIDVCGEMLDTYRVEIRETMVDLSKTQPAVSGNDPLGKPNVWNIQFDNGHLIAREESHMVQRTSIRRNVNGQDVDIPFTATYDYVSTLDQPTPAPLDAAPPGAAQPEEDVEEEEGEEEEGP